ncbi:MAG TPA: glycosyltransferase family 4 protein [Saprospiraceae bacterium]|nr:glycosyltransferase family 4 protein [Saprospiraceae bacterium]
MNKPIRVLFISRATLYSVKGGDTIQILNTAEALTKLNVTVDIKLCNDIFIDYAMYDLVHFFNIIRPADMLIHIEKCKKPFVVSTIFVDYSAYENYTAKTNWKMKLLNIFSSDTREYIKAIGRMILNSEKINSTKYLRWGHRKSIRYILRNAALLLPNSESEYLRLLKAYGIKQEYLVVNNAADIDTFNCTQATISEKDKSMVICVARIEGRKNQLNLIKALNGTPFNLFIIGNASPNHVQYYEKCKKIASSNIYFISELSQVKLIAYYKKAKVHILPSWFETTGLSSLEALFCGCNIVVSAYGDTTDYFNFNNALFCKPESIISIRQSVEQAAGTKTNIDKIEEAMTIYNWSRTAETTLSAYKTLLTSS